MDTKSQENFVTIIQAYWRGYRIRKCILQTRFEYEEIAQEIRNEAGLGNEADVGNDEVRWPCEKKICYPVHGISNEEVVSKNEDEHYQPDSKIHCDDNGVDDGGIADIECTTVNADDGESNNINISTNNTEETSHIEQPNKLSPLKKIEDNIIRSSSPIFSRVVEVEEEERTGVVKDRQNNLGEIQTGGLLTESWMTDKSFDDTSSTSSFVNSNNTTSHHNTTRNTNNSSNNNNNNSSNNNSNNNNANNNHNNSNNNNTNNTITNNTITSNTITSNKITTTNNDTNNNNNNDTTTNNNSTNNNNDMTKEDLVCKQKELMLELIWLQQAIHSRKVYLQLKRKAS